MNKITVYKNGIIYTVDEEKRICHAMATMNDRILAVGSLDYVDERVESAAEPDDLISTVDLKGKMILPGFIEAHAHPSLASMEMVFQVDLSNCKNADEYLERISDYLKDHPETEFLQGAGWINPHFDMSGPRKEGLDAISKDIPMALVSGDHHSIWANSKAIELACVTHETESPPGGIIEKDADTGEPLGTFREEAQDYIRAIVPPYTVEQCEKGMLHYQKVMAGYGFTMSHDAMLFLDTSQHLALASLDRADNLLFKMSASVTAAVNDLDFLDDIKEKIEPQNGKRFRVNHIKFFLDGVIEGKTGWLKEPYADGSGYCGEKMWEDENLAKALSMIDKQGYQAHFHIIGDAAAKQMMDSLKELDKVNGKKHRRPVAAHCQIIDPADIPSMADYDNLIVGANPYWFFKEAGYYNGIELPLLGEERAENEYPIKTFLDLGMTVTSASDFSVTPDPNPLFAMQLAVLRKLPHMPDSDILGADQRLTLEDIIPTFTINAAYAVSMEDETGSIEEGKLADLVILEKNIFDVDIEDVDKVKVLATISEGKLIYSAEWA